MRYLRQVIAGTTAAILILVLTACSDMLSPGKNVDINTPARLSLNTSIPRFQESAFSRVELRVRAEYLRQNETRVLISTQTVALNDQQTQQVPVSIETGQCLSDPERMTDEGGNAGSCLVVLTLTLLGDGRVLDERELYGVLLTPGAVTTVSETVELHEVSTVRIVAVGGTEALPAQQLISGNTLALDFRALDAANGVVSGRTASWSSSNSAVATVSTDGVVTAVSTGTTTITAVVGGRSGSVDFTILPPPQRLSIESVAGTGSGRITSQPQGIDCVVNGSQYSGSCSFDFPHGATVVLTAEENSNSRFEGWTGYCSESGESNVCELSVNESRSTGVRFTAYSFVSVDVSVPAGNIRLASQPPHSGINCLVSASNSSGVCRAEFPVGDTVVIAQEGNLSTTRVNGFTGCDEASTTSCTVVVGNTERGVIAQTIPGVSLRVSLSGNGQGTVSAQGMDPATGGDLSCSSLDGSCEASYPAGVTVPVTATALSGHRFDGWQGAGCDSVSGNVCNVSLNANVDNLVAMFSIAQVQVTLRLSGSGGGIVSNGDEVVCELPSESTFAQCTLNVAINDTLILSGAPAGSGQFLGFGSPCASGNGNCVLFVNSPLDITAAFTSQPPAMSLTIVPSANNTGRGSVSIGGQSGSCSINLGSSSGTCEASIQAGASVQVTASDTPGSNPSVFLRWSQGSPCFGSNNPVCSFTMISNTQLSAEYVPATQFVTQIFPSSGSGRVEFTVNNFRSVDPCNSSMQQFISCTYLLPVNRSFQVYAVPLDQNVYPIGESSSACEWNSGDLGYYCGVTTRAQSDTVRTSFMFDFDEEEGDVAGHSSMYMAASHGFDLFPWRPGFE